MCGVFVPKEKEVQMGKLVKCVINIVGLFLVLSLFAVFSGLEEDNLLNDFIGVANMISIAVCIAGVVTEQKLYIWIAYIGNTILGFMCMGVVKDKPSFIYKIPGETFIGIMIAWAVLVLPVVLRFADGKVKRYLKKNVGLAKQETYSDSEIMLLKKFDRYMATGYYLLKAKLHGIIEYKETVTEETSVRTYGVELNPNLSEEKRKEYCKTMPQIANIVEYLIQKHSAGEENVRVAGLVSDVESSLEFDSKKTAFEYVKTADDFGIGGLLFCIFTLIYTFITKWMMCVYNSNTPQYFVLAGFGSVALMFIVYGNGMDRREKLIKEVFVNEILKPEIEEYGNISQMFQQTDFENTGCSEEEGKKLLRAYVLYEYPRKEYLNSGDRNRFSDALFAGVAEAYDRAKAGRED